MATIENNEINTNYVPSTMLDSDGNVLSDYETVATQISQGVTSMIVELPPVEQALFFALLLKLFADLAADEWTTDNVTTNLQQVSDDTEILANEFATGGGTKKIAELLAQLLMLLETSSVDQRQLARESSQKMSYSQAKQLRKEGDQLMEKALVSFAITVLFLTISLISAGVSFMKSSEQVKHAKSSLESTKTAHFYEEKFMNPDLDSGDQVAAYKDMNTHSDKATELKNDALSAEKLAYAFQSGSDSTRSIGQMGSTITQGIYDQELKETEGEQVKRASMVTYYTSESDIEREFKENLRKAVELLKQLFETMFDADVQEMSAINSGIGR